MEILEYAKGKTDKMYFWAPPSKDNVLFYGEIEKENIKTIKWEEEKSIYTKTVIKTPLGELSQLFREDEGVHTAWNTEPLCKNQEDAEKVLSLPYVPWHPPVDSYFQLEKRLGNSGIIMGDIPDALCLTVKIFGFSKFLTLYIDNRSLILRLINSFQERVYNYLEHLLEKGAVTLYRIVGPEYATFPYLPAKEFDTFVTSYDKELVSLLHQYGGLARLHSHGKIKGVLRSFKEMEIDAVDPLEPPPDGDIELKEARRMLPDVTLIGNIEERLFEVGSKDDIENAVKKAIEEASGGGFILCPTAMPLTSPLDKKIQEKIIHYIDCGTKYGKV